MHFLLSHTFLSIFASIKPIYQDFTTNPKIITNQKTN